jgi:hypothetical protein
MDSAPDTPLLGRVGSLHVHPSLAGAPMETLPALELVSQMGIKEDLRYFGRRSRTSGQPTVRQVSLMAREEILQHAQALDLPEIPPGAVRANIETLGVEWVALVGKQVRIGEAVLLVCEPRKPCAKMDLLCQGLRARMESNRQGVLAQVMVSGRVATGDRIVLLNSTA